MKHSDLSSSILQDALKHVMFDETVKQVRTRTKQQPQIVKRADKQIVVYFKGVLKDGTLKYVTPSGTTPGLFWNQRVKLKDLKKYIRDTSMTDVKKVRAALTGNIAVHCDDPSFKFWGYQYIGTINGYSIKKETRFPIIRNPKLRGGLCKHLEAVLRVLPFHATKIVKAYRDAGIL